jgi:hypothetical protein
MTPRIILGLGAGHCGLGALAAVLAQQPATRVTVAQPPLLPWVPRQSVAAVMRARFARWAALDATLVGDVAAFYLPYVVEAVAADPNIRIVCLKRPEAEVAAGFRAQLDRPGFTPVNHWTTRPAPGWTQHPLLTPTYPQYDDVDREAGLARYWRDYYQRAEEYRDRFPGQFRIMDAADLGDADAVRDLLDFLGIPRAAQVVVTATSPTPPAPATTLPERRPPLDPSRCVVLVPYTGAILPECEEGLRALERRGYQVRRVGGYAAIDQGRNQLATDALVEGFEETLWIDSDIGFHPDDVETLRRHGVPIVGGLYPLKGVRGLAAHVLPGTKAVRFGADGGLLELLYAGAGFLLVRREVYLAVQLQERLPVCNERFGRPMVPYFEPTSAPDGDGCWYLAEDFAFCARARRCGYKILVDTTLRLWHVGTYRYGWEDAGTARPKFASFTLNLE